MDYGLHSWAAMEIEQGDDWSLTVATAVRNIGLAELWRRLVSGTVTVVSTWHSARECGVKLRCPVEPNRRIELGARGRSVIERILVGESQKCISIDLTLAASTVALIGRESLSAMGVTGSASRFPLILVLAAHAATGIRVPSARLMRTTGCEGGELIVIAERPDDRLHGILSDAEVQVARLLVEGQSHAQIAQRRERSKRTVANQLASTFRKLNVSGRGELLSKLVRERQQMVAVA
jgi:DNA-binding CsgD family transcriptional regulator